MSSFASYYAWYGNRSLSNNRIQLTDFNINDAVGKELQTIPLARANGSSVVRSRYTARTISLKGGYTPTINNSSNISTDTIQKEDQLMNMSDEVNKIFSSDDRYFRIVPISKVKMIDTADSIADVTISGDGSNKAVSNSVFEFNKSSVGFDVTVSGGSVTYVKALSAGVDLSSATTSNLGNFEFSLNIDDVYYISSIDFRIGSSNANYYSKTFTSNYEGLALENGVNLFSVPWGNSVQGKTITETGTVDKTQIGKYEYIKINYSTSASNFKVKVNGVWWANEDYIRNYPCYRDGEITYNSEWYRVDNMPNYFGLKLLNYSGYSISTHSITLFTQSGITASSSLKSVDLKGSLAPALRNQFVLKTVTNLTDLRYQNLSLQETIKWTNTWTAGDIVVFDKLLNYVTKNGLAQDFTGKLPSSTIGVNKLQMQVVTGSDVTISQLVNNTDGGATYLTTLYIAQSFVATSSGTLSQISALINESVEGPNFTFSVYSDNTDKPGTLLWTNFHNFTYTDGQARWETENPNISVTNGTKYWIVIPVSSSYFGYSLWRYQSSGDFYASGKRKTSTDFVTWTETTNADNAFTVTITPTPSTNIDWTVSYKPLYL